MQNLKCKINDKDLFHTQIDRILIRAPNWLGDSVMSIPTVNGVKRLFPNSTIYVWTKTGLMDLWRLLPSVDGVVDSVPKRHNFDLGILLTNSFSSALRMYLAGVPERRGYSVNGRGFLLTQPIQLKDKGNLHQVEYFLGIIDNVDVEHTPRIDVSVQLREEAMEFLSTFGWDGKTSIIGVHATASYGPAKFWLPERFAELMDRLVDRYNVQILLVGNEDVGEIVAGVKNSLGIINLVGKTDITMLAGVVGLCKLFIANDSGPMHLASSLGVPVVAIFGSTSPEKTGPRGRCIVIRKDLSCSPCFRRRCPRDLECMKLITVQDVLRAVEELYVHSR